MGWFGETQKEERRQDEARRRLENIKRLDAQKKADARRKLLDDKLARDKRKQEYLAERERLKIHRIKAKADVTAEKARLAEQRRREKNAKAKPVRHARPHKVIRLSKKHSW
jgi:hypothetical protein